MTEQSPVTIPAAGAVLIGSDLSAADDAVRFKKHPPRPPWAFIPSDPPAGIAVQWSNKLLETLQIKLDQNGLIDWDLWCVDGVSVRATRAAAGASKKKAPSVSGSLEEKSG